MYIDGNKLAFVVSDLLKLTEFHLLECVENKQTVQKVLPNHRKDTYSLMVKVWAVSKFKQFLEILRAKKVLKEMKEIGYSFNKIFKCQKHQRRREKFQIVVFWLKYYMKRKKIEKVLKERENRYVDVMQKFKENWGTIKQSERYEIHICSYSLDEFQRITMTHLNQRQNSQILRIFSLSDPLVTNIVRQDEKVEIIYIVPGKLQQEIASYIQKLFLINHKEENLKRIHFISPEHSDYFPQHFSLSKVLYYSPLSLKFVKDLIKDKYAYLVPSIPNREDKYIGQYLEIPLFCGDVAAISKLRRRDYGRQLLKELDIPITQGEEFIFSEQDLINKLTLLLIKNPQVTTFYVKLNTEIDGRGIAQIQFENVKYFRKLRKAVNYQFTEKRIAKIRTIISDILPLKLIPCMKSLFLNYYEFLTRIQDTGCVVEAIPIQNISGSSQINFRIDPDGSIQYIASFDKIQMHDVIPCGVTFPQRQLSNLNIDKICSTIGVKLYSQNVWGYIKVDFIVLSERQRDPFRTGQKSQLFQVIGIDCILDCYTSSFMLFDFLCQGQLLPNNQYIIQNQGEDYKNNTNSVLRGHESHQILLKQHTNQTLPPSQGGITSVQLLQSEQQIQINQPQSFLQQQKCFTYIPMVFHQGLQEYRPKQFFQLCRDQQIAFDIQNKNGTIFILPGSLQHGMINILSIASDLKTSVGNMVESLNFLVNKFGTKIKYHFDKDKHRQFHLFPQIEFNNIFNQLNGRSDNYYLVDVLGSVRELNKVLELNC